MRMFQYRTVAAEGFLQVEFQYVEGFLQVEFQYVEGFLQVESLEVEAVPVESPESPQESLEVEKVSKVLAPTEFRVSGMNHLCL